MILAIDERVWCVFQRTVHVGPASSHAGLASVFHSTGSATVTTTVETDRMKVGVVSVATA